MGDRREGLLAWGIRPSSDTPGFCIPCHPEAIWVLASGCCPEEGTRIAGLGVSTFGDSLLLPWALGSCCWGLGGRETPGLSFRDEARLGVVRRVGALSLGVLPPPKWHTVFPAKTTQSRTHPVR